MAHSIAAVIIKSLIYLYIWKSRLSVEDIKRGDLFSSVFLSHQNLIYDVIKGFHLGADWNSNLTPSHATLFMQIVIEYYLVIRLFTT